MLSSLKYSTFRPVSQLSSQVEYIQDFEDESQEYALTKVLVFVWMGRFNFGDMDFAKNIRFSHISQRQEACGMFLLNKNSLCYFKNLYSWRKVNFLSKIVGKSSVLLCAMPEHPFIISNKSLIAHCRYRIETNLLLPSFFPGFVYVISVLSKNSHHHSTSSSLRSFSGRPGFLLLKMIRRWNF